jgi:hypothetical protein
LRLPRRGNFQSGAAQAATTHPKAAIAARRDTQAKRTTQLILRIDRIEDPIQFQPQKFQ